MPHKTTDIIETAKVAACLCQSAELSVGLPSLKKGVYISSALPLAVTNAAGKILRRNIPGALCQLGAQIFF